MKTVIKLVNGGVAIMNLAEGENAAENIAKWSDELQSKVVSYREMPDDAIPEDRSQRHLWADISDDLVIDIDSNLGKVVIPKYVTMRQARLALLNAGLLKTIDDAVANMPGVEGDAARIEWEFSNAVERDKEFVKSIASGLRLTDDQVDQLFIAAALL